MTPHRLEDQQHTCARRAGAGVLLAACTMFAVGCQQDAQSRPATAWEKPQHSRVGSLRPQAEPKLLPVTHFASAQLLEESGDLTGAILQYRRTIAMNHDFIAAYERLALLLDRMGQYYDAEQVWQKAIERAPDNASLHNNLGFHHLVQRQYREAAESFDNALLADPTYDRARINLGITLAQMGQTAEALEAFRQALTEDHAQYNLGLVLRQNLKYEEARRAFEAALRANPRLTAARVHLAQLPPPATEVAEPLADSELAAAHGTAVPRVLAAPKASADEAAPLVTVAPEPEMTTPPAVPAPEPAPAQEAETELASAPMHAAEPTEVATDTMIPATARTPEPEVAVTAAPTAPATPPEDASPASPERKPSWLADWTDVVERAVECDPRPWDRWAAPSPQESEPAPEPEPADAVETELSSGPMLYDATLEWAMATDAITTRAREHWETFMDALREYVHTMWSRQEVRQAHAAAQRPPIDVEPAARTAEAETIHDEIPVDHPCWGEDQTFFEAWSDVALAEWPNQDFPYDLEDEALTEERTAGPAAPSSADQADQRAAQLSTPTERYQELLADEDLSLTELVAAEISEPMEPVAPVVSETRTWVDFDDVDDELLSPEHPTFTAGSRHVAAWDQPDAEELRQLLIPPPTRESAAGPLAAAVVLETPTDPLLPWDLSRRLPDAQAMSDELPARRPAGPGPLMLRHDYGLSQPEDWTGQGGPIRPIPPPMR
jgi:tetratricopeptide (TPR) repeat protein